VKVDVVMRAMLAVILTRKRRLN